VNTATLRPLLLTCAVLASPAGWAACSLEIGVGDNLAYDTTELEAEKSCETVELTITHGGNLPKVAMGHNWVLVRPGDFQAVAPLGISAGVEGDYVPDDERVIANTPLVGGGESATIEFSVTELEAGEYTFFCSFPGHYSVMKGTFRLL
jgi:azurin